MLLFYYLQQDFNDRARIPYVENRQTATASVFLRPLVISHFTDATDQHIIRDL